MAAAAALLRRPGLALLLVLGSLRASAASPSGRVPLRYGCLGCPARERRHRARPAAAHNAAGPPPRFVTQRQDHFDGANGKTWQQAYYTNDTFWKVGSSAPIFLCVGGEGPPLDGSAVVDSVHCNNAVEWLPETGALMFALEHRYYGCHNASACPVSNLSRPDSLRYLSSRQALGDIAGFIRYAHEAYGLAAANRWVTWGGSYPGMLAGWARLKFPHLVFASASSSAPVRAELNMEGYNDVVAQAYAVSHERVGGSPECRAAIAKGHADIGERLGSEVQREGLASLFGLEAEWLAKRENQAAFAGEGVADFPAQANDPACEEPMCNIAKICAAMTNVSLGDEVSRLAHVRSTQRAWSAVAAPPAPESSRQAGAPRAHEEPAPGWNEADLWGWQTCTEFGFYQTCDVGSECFFTQGLATLEDQMSFCTTAFGIPSSLVAANVEYSNAYYGAALPQGSRVLWVNGEVDPWHANSINKPLSPGFPALYVAGASHHAWTHPSLPSDQESVKIARGTIRNFIASFLAEADDEATVLV